VACAEALEHAKDSQGAFQVYMDAVKLIDMGGKNKKEVDQTKKQHVERLVVTAIKSPQTLNFEEILLLDAIQLYTKQSKSLLQLVDLFLQKDIK